MPKKMHDILPPKVAHKVEDIVRSLGAKPKKKTAQRKSIPQRKAAPFPRKAVLASVGVVVLALCVWGAVKLPKAEIQIWPTTESLPLTQKITLDTKAASPDISTSIIPATYIEVIQEGVQEFPATGIGDNDGKATGTITIFNKLDSTFSLVKGTHFLSDSSKYFVTNAKVSIPAAQTVKGKVTPGSIDVQVTATEAGTDYNIGASKFSIPKLNGTSYYYSVYAESSSNMTGGYLGKVKKVTSDDILQAKDLLTRKTLQDGEAALKAKLAIDDILLDGAIETSVIDAVCDVAPNTIKDTFTETVKVKAAGLVFKRQDLEKLVKDKIKSQLPVDRDFVPASLTLEYTPSSLLDIKKGTLTLNVKSSVNTYKGIEINSFIDVLSKKSSDQIRSTIEEIYDGNVTKTQVKFWPFWVTKSPSDKDRINIHLNFSAEGGSASGGE